MGAYHNVTPGLMSRDSCIDFVPHRGSQGTPTTVAAVSVKCGA